MPNGDIILAIVAFLATAMGIFGTISSIYTNRKRNMTMDTTTAENNGKQEGTVLTELGYIRANVDDIKRKQETVETQNKSILEKLAATTEWRHSVDRRLDQLESKIK